MNLLLGFKFIKLTLFLAEDKLGERNPGGVGLRHTKHNELFENFFRLIAKLPTDRHERTLEVISRQV